MKNKIILTLSAVLLLTLMSCAVDVQKKNMPEGKSATLIAAYGTSYSAESANAVSILEPSFNGFWQPQSQDFGVNEGVYFQFLEPILINFIEVTADGDVKDKLTLQPYLNGQTQTRKSEITTAKIPIKTFEKKDEARGTMIWEGGKYYHSRSGRLVLLNKNGAGSYSYRTGEQAKVSVSADENGNEQEYVEEDSTEFYYITVSTEMKNGNTVFTIKENSTNNLNYITKSVFLKIKDAKILPKIKSVKIFGEDLKMPLSINVPLTPKGSVKATSVLNPARAYSPENLFDSQLDMAWSTNGKETDGIDQSITVSFDKKEEIGGIVIWNGYQRSDAHFKGNGRVKKLDINGQTVDVNDEQGLQTILLPKKIKSKKIKLTIKEIFKSKKYKDVLISELRFITPEGQIILPQIERAAAELPETNAIKTDITYINLIEAVQDNGEAEPNIYYATHDTLRIRSNGSFVLYREGENKSAGISEGNWQEMGKNKIRIFGKKYRIIPSVTNTGMYSFNAGSSEADDPDVKPAEVVIFQSDIILSKFNSLTKKEQENIIKFVAGYIADEDNIGEVFIRTQNRIGSIWGVPMDDYSDEEEYRSSFKRWYEMSLSVMLEDIATKFEKINPVCIKSDVYTGLMIPYDEVK